MAASRIEPLLLGTDDAGEMLTLQRAAYVTEAQAHRDVMMPPLKQTLSELRAELADPLITAWGIRDLGRLVASVRLRFPEVDTAEAGRLVVAPDRQGQGLGSALMLAVEARLPESVAVIRLLIPEHSLATLNFCRRLGYRETGRVRTGSYDLIGLAKTRQEYLR